MSSHGVLPKVSIGVQRFSLLLDVVSAYDNCGAFLFEVWRFEVNLFEDCVDNCPEPSRSDIVLLIQFHRDACHFCDRFFIKDNVEVLNLEQFRRLFEKVVLSLCQYVLEVFQ